MEATKIQIKRFNRGVCPHICIAYLGKETCLFSHGDMLNFQERMRPQSSISDHNLASIYDRARHQPVNQFWPPRSTPSFKFLLTIGNCLTPNSVPSPTSSKPCAKYNPLPSIVDRKYTSLGPAFLASLHLPSATQLNPSRSNIFPIPFRCCPGLTMRQCSSTVSSLLRPWDRCVSTTLSTASPCCISCARAVLSSPGGLGLPQMVRSVCCLRSEGERRDNGSRKARYQCAQPTTTSVPSDSGEVPSMPLGSVFCSTARMWRWPGLAS